MPSLKFFGIILKRGKINKIIALLFYLFYKEGKESGCILYFITGILFIYFIIPLLESVLSFLATWLKYKETKYSAETYKISKKAQKEATEGENRTHVIGFSYDNEEYDEEEIPEEEDDENDT